MNPGADLVRMQYPLINVQDMKGVPSNVIYQIGPLQYIPTSGFYDLPIKTDRRPDQVTNQVFINAPGLPNGAQFYQMAQPYPPEYVVGTDSRGFSVPVQYPTNYISNGVVGPNYVAATNMEVPANYNGLNFMGNGENLVTGVKTESSGYDEDENGLENENITRNQTPNMYSVVPMDGHVPQTINYVGNSLVGVPGTSNFGNIPSGMEMNGIPSYVRNPVEVGPNFIGNIQNPILTDVKQPNFIGNPQNTIDVSRNPNYIGSPQPTGNVRTSNFIRSNQNGVILEADGSNYIENDNIPLDHAATMPSYEDNLQNAMESVRNGSTGFCPQNLPYNSTYMQNNNLEMPINENDFNSYIPANTSAEVEHEYLNQYEKLIPMSGETVKQESGTDVSQRNQFGSYVQNNMPSVTQQNFMERFNPQISSTHNKNGDSDNVMDQIKFEVPVRPEDVMAYRMQNDTPEQEDDYNDTPLNVKPHKSFVCKICDKAFVYIRNLNKHMSKFHSIDSQQKVSIETPENELVEHTVPVVCSKTKLYKCKVCDEKFELVTRLRRHEFEHTNEKPFICKYCDMSFAQAIILIQHVQKNHPDNI